MLSGDANNIALIGMPGVGKSTIRPDGGNRYPDTGPGSDANS